MQLFGLNCSMRQGRYQMMAQTCKRMSWHFSLRNTANICSDGVKFGMVVAERLRCPREPLPGKQKATTGEVQFRTCDPMIVTLPVVPHKAVAEVSE